MLKSDQTIEDVHFTRGEAPWELFGRKAIARVLSDLGAVGARPIACLCSLALPDDVDEEAARAVLRGVLSLAEGMAAFALAGMLALTAGRDAGVAAHAAALAAPLAIGLASAGAALLVALQAQAIGAEGRTVPALAVAAFALAAWVTHCALRLRRARRAAMRARQRDWALVRPTRRRAAAPTTAPWGPTAAARRLRPAAQWS